MLRFSEKSRRSKIILHGIPAGRLVAVLSLCSLFLLSCATFPPLERTTGWLAVLPPLTADSLYMSVDVAKSRGLLEALAEASGGEKGELERIIGKLDRVHACIRLSPGKSPEQVPEFSLIALGKLSPGSVACQLNRDRSWERVMLERLPGRGSYRTYWRKDGFEIAAPARGIVFVAGGGPAGGDSADGGSAGAESLLRRLHSPEAQPLPVQARGEPETADISIRQGWISARRHESDSGAAQEGREDYELEAVFLLDQVESARSVELLLRLMLTLLLRKVQVEDPVQTLKAVTVSADSESARIESLFLEAGEIASFIKILLPENLGSGGRS
jgi:hypothetical protein